MIEETIVTTLENSSEVGALADDRIYADPLRQNAVLPCVSYRKVSGSRGYTLAGPDGTAQARFQFDCWATSFDEAKQLHEAVIDALNAMTNAEVNVSADLDSYEPEPGLQRVIVDAEFLYDV